MIEHFGIKVRENSFLNRENYAEINRKSSFKIIMSNVEYENIESRIYTEHWCKEYQQKCLLNFDINMERYNKLDLKEFQNEISSFLLKYKNFEEITNINELNDVSGYYIMILDKYKQLYIGTTENIGKRIKQHWSKKKQFDRLLFPMNNVENSKLSIDSFRALDTTRIFVAKSKELYNLENEYIRNFSEKFVINRVPGGKILPIEGLISNKPKESDSNVDIFTTITIGTIIIIFLWLFILISNLISTS